MSTPIIEQIADKLVDYVNAITVANGYNQDLTAIRPKRLHLESDINRDRLVIIQQEEIADVETESTQTIIWQQPFAVQAIVVDSDDATDPIDTRLNTVRSDIEKKLMSDECRTLGGLGQIYLAGATKFIDDAANSGISVDVIVMYEVLTNDPCSSG